MFTDAAVGELVHDLALQDQGPLLRPISRFGRPAAITFTADHGAPADMPAAI